MTLNRSEHRACKTVAIALSLALAATSGCYNFRDLDADGRCGNEIWEPISGEDCEGTADIPGAVCGAPDTPQACRISCADGAACPDGWRCGTDFVCRASSGTFGEPQVIPQSGNLLHVADMDGDGRRDLVTFGDRNVQVAYNDADVPFIVTLEQAAPSYDRTPRLLDIDADGSKDIALPLFEGVQLMRGSAARSVIPLTLPSAVLPVSEPTIAVGVRIRTPYLFDDTLLITQGQTDVRFALEGFPTHAAGIEAEIANPPGPLAPSIAVRDVEAEPEASTPEERTAEEVAFGFQGDDRVYVVDLSCDQQACTLNPRQTVTLGGGLTVTAQGGVFFGDRDGDGILDLLAVVDSPGGVRVAVMTGGVDGDFAPPIVDSTLDEVVSCDRCPMDAQVGLLAVADMDGDGGADFVSRTATYLSDGAGNLVPSMVAERAWRAASVADFDGNGFLDIAAIGPGRLEIAHLTDDLLFNTTSLVIPGASEAVLTGDFDGNLLPDIAYNADGEISVLYSDGTMLAGEPVVVAEAPRVTNLKTIREQGDGIDDLMFSGVSESGASLLYRLSGRGSRQLSSLIEKTGPVFVAVEPGRFLSSPAELLVVEINAMPRALTFRVVDLVSRRDGPPTFTMLTVPNDCGIPKRIGAAVAISDLDGDGRDEIIVVETYSPESPMPGDEAVPGTYRLAVMSVDDSGMVSCSNMPSSTTDASPRIDSLEVADFDGDGHLDVFTLLVATPPDLDQTPGFTIWWGQGEGAFGSPYTYLLDALPFTGTSHSATAQLDQEEGQEVLIIHDGVLDAFSLRERVAQRIPLGIAPRDTMQLSGGDLDGDGLDDIVLMTRDATFVYTADACDARAEAEGECTR